MRGNSFYDILIIFITIRLFTITLINSISAELILVKVENNIKHLFKEYHTLIFKDK
jgi:hypothetical protein